MRQRYGNQSVWRAFRRHWLPVLGLVAVVECLGFFPALIERFYSTCIYTGLSQLLRLLTGWIPFSLGDVLYALATAWLLVKFLRFCYELAKGRVTWRLTGRKLLRLLHLLLWVYVVFQLAWGLNYSRPGIESQLNLRPEAYKKEDADRLCALFIERMNACRRQMPDSSLRQPAIEQVFDGAETAYAGIAGRFPFLHYRARSVKTSLYSATLGSYFGFTGYYDPFTGEAQVRSDIPRVLTPYIACHEMAHQLGYASESEANFVGYLAASRSGDPYFRYSVYLDLFSYAQGEELRLYFADGDTTGLKQVLQSHREQLDTLVKKDRREIREFFFRRRNRISPVMSGLYDQYLKFNRQSLGIDSYDEVLGWMLAYEKKYGSL